MSKIEVDAIDKQSGSTLTLGGSGTAVTLACGATQTGFGRTGTVDWNTTPKTATFTAVSGDGFFANTTGSAFNMNLPAGVAGAIVSVADYAGTWQTNNLTVVPNGTDKIGSVNANATLSTQGQSVTFIFVDSTQGWINTMDSTSNARGSAFICASVSGTGNTLAIDGDFKVATFTGPGNFTVNSVATTPANNAVAYAVIAAGGGGGKNRGGGGGAGGFREGRCAPITPYTASPLVASCGVTVTAQAYPIVVGGGGAGIPGPAGGDGCIGGKGNTSSGLGITSTGGGGGGSRDTGSLQPAPAVAPASGGSGGGYGSSGPSGASPTSPPNGGSGNTPPVSPVQGTDGGSNGRGSPYSGGTGGGGATVQGSPNNLTVPTVPGFPAGGHRGTAITPGGGGVGGDGGQGATTSITGSAVGYAGGGAGGGSCNPSIWSPNDSLGGTGGMFGNPGTGTGALFGGGNGGSGDGSSPPNNGTNAADNKGGGGGGGSGGGATGANGGSGIVIIRYKFQ